MDLINSKFSGKVSIVHILILALTLRLLSAVFSQGFGMHDDHFLVVEVAQSWAEGRDFNNWFVDDYEDNVSGRGILYPGLHYVLFSLMDSSGLGSPKLKMLVARIFHALYSILVVYYAYRFVLLLDSRKNAITVALIISMLWFMPYASVRNLAEMVAIPPLLMASYWTIRENLQRRRTSFYLMSGFLFALAFALRYQTATYVLGFLIGLAILRSWKPIALICLSGLATFSIIHGYGDYLASGKPFGKILFYVLYNLQFGGDYISQPWYQYIFVVIGFLVPPAGLFFFSGAFKSPRTWLPVLYGVAVFFIVHSILKGKQERFIFTMLPFFVMLGQVGWPQVREKIRWKKWPSFERGCWRFALIINTIALVFVTFWYSKKSRVEAMSFLYGKKNITGIIVANETRNTVNMMPLYYSGAWPEQYSFAEGQNFEEFIHEIQSLPDEKQPNYLFLEKKPGESTTERLKNWQGKIGRLSFVKEIKGSFMDHRHYAANRHVKSDDYDIYKIE